MDRAMRVLHLPVNMASVMSTNVAAQRAIGMDARGFVSGEQSSKVTSAGLMLMPQQGTSRHLWFMRQFMWADIVHWYWGDPVLPRGRDLGMIRRFRKPCVVEWMGSDVRRLEVEMLDNPAFRDMWFSDEAFRNLWRRSSARSEDYQLRFQGIGAVPIVHPARHQYLLESIGDRHICGMRAIDVKNLECRFPDPLKTRPLIVHSPSHRAIKGSHVIIKAVESLLAEGLEFDFRLVENMTHQQAIAAVADADIFIDSVIMGNYGLAAMEAMAQGKPVVCYVKDSVRAKYPASLPIINATVESLVPVLRQLIPDGEARARLGRESRAYTEQYHESTGCAQRMRSAYEAVIAARGGAALPDASLSPCPQAS